MILYGATEQNSSLQLVIINDVRIHDLRHSFASRALAMGESPPMIGKLLGHRKAQTTARDAHLAREYVKASTARVAESVRADHGLLPSTVRPAVSIQESSGTGTQRGHSNPSATLTPTARLSTTSPTSSLISLPACWRSPCTTAHPNLRFLMEPMSAQ